mmetsp:Transcript_45333/g.142204  ORF Transcript_45333/g.142204 Transcript_45333/m.142204 type:complete len:375 (-) Transcript_45333:176-1300(-)
MKELLRLLGGEGLSGRTSSKSTGKTGGWSGGSDTWNAVGSLSRGGCARATVGSVSSPVGTSSIGGSSSGGMAASKSKGFTAWGCIRRPSHSSSPSRANSRTQASSPSGGRTGMSAALGEGASGRTAGSSAAMEGGNSEPAVTVPALTSTAAIAEGSRSGERPRSGVSMHRNALAGEQGSDSPSSSQKPARSGDIQRATSDGTTNSSGLLVPGIANMFSPSKPVSSFSYCGDCGSLMSCSCAWALMSLSCACLLQQRARLLKARVTRATVTRHAATIRVRMAAPALPVPSSEPAPRSAGGGPACGVAGAIVTVVVTVALAASVAVVVAVVVAGVVLVAAVAFVLVVVAVVVSVAVVVAVVVLVLVAVDAAVGFKV